MAVDKAAMAISLESLRAETVRLAADVAAPTFGVKAPQTREVYMQRAHLKTTVSDGVVSELDLLRAGTLMATFTRAAEGARARGKDTEATIRREVALALLALEPQPPSEEKVAAEMANVSPELVAHHVSERAKAVEICAHEAGVVAALHGAIAAQLAAQPGYVSALEYLKDNAQRFGVTDAIENARNTIGQLGNVEVAPEVKDAFKKIVRTVENTLGRLFGSR